MSRDESPLTDALGRRIPFDSVKRCPLRLTAPRAGRRPGRQCVLPDGHHGDCSIVPSGDTLGIASPDRIMIRRVS